MKKNLTILAIIFLAAIFQTSIMPLFFSKGNIPDVVLVILVSAVAVFGFPAVWVWAIFSGFVMDIFSFGKIGSNVLSFMLYCYFVSFFSRRIILGEKIGGILAGTVFVSIMTVFYNIFIYIFNYGFKFQEMWGIKFIFLENMLWKIIFNLILFFISLVVLKHIERKFSPSNNLLLGR